MKLPSITDFDLYHKRVLIREDFNVPIIQGKVVSDSRILPALHTIQYALAQNASVILISHLERPKEPVTTFSSLKPVAYLLSNLLGISVRFTYDWIEGISIRPGEVILCENVRLQPGEQTNDLTLAKKIAQLADICVMDAFAVSHRIAASTVGLMRYAKNACIGLLMQAELENLSYLMKRPKKSFVSIIGGAKVSTKLSLLPQLIQKSDHLLLSGALATTFLAAQHPVINDHLYEKDHLKDIPKLFELAKNYACQIHLPQDIITATYHKNAIINAQNKSVLNITPNEYIGDIGPYTIENYFSYLTKADTIVWNGPMGIFEEPEFQSGTIAIARIIESHPAFSIIGGGDTLAALEHFAITLPLISTGGGAFLSFLGGTPSPVIQALHARKNLF